jgi:adenylate cyclase
VERKLTAILCADVHGYSRLMGENEEATVGTLSAYRKIIDDLIEQHHGRFVNSAGDSVLAEFPSVVNAVECAVEIQTNLMVENAGLPPERRMEFRIGVNLGDVVVDGDQIYGDGVNVAARLESLAQPGGINVSGSVHEQIGSRLPLSYEDLGEQQVKNIAKSVRVFRVLSEAGTPSPRKAQRVQKKYVRRGALSLGGLAVIAAAMVLIQHVSLKPPHTSASIPPVQSPALTLPDKPSIVVLPFTNLSGDHEQEYFSDGITDDLITDLSRLPGLFVIARTSSFTYRGKPAKLQEVGKELGVRYVLQGSVRKARGQVRITVQLADASTGAELWAERYNRPLRDVFALQDEIVRKIVTTLNLQINLAQKGIIIPRSTQNLEAYDDLLRGVEYGSSLTMDGNRKAREMTEKAIELDPKYAMAYAELGWVYWLGRVLQFSPDPNSLERASQMEQKAIALDDSVSWAHSVLAAVEVQEGKYDQALIEARRGIALDPNSAAGYLWLAEVLNEIGRPADALVATDNGVRLDPRNAETYALERGCAYTRLERWTEAIPALKSFLGRYPDVLWANVWLAEDYYGVGDEHAAGAEAAEVERTIALDPNSALGYLGLAEVMNTLDRPVEALAAAEKGMHLDPRNGGLYAFAEAWACSQLGRWKEEIADVKRYLARFPANLFSHSDLAEAYGELGDEEAARTEAAEVEKAIALNPDFGPGYFELAEVMNANGRPLEALAAVEKGVRLDPHNHKYLFQQGWAYTQLRRWEEAISVLKHFLTSHPDHFGSHLCLAVDYVELGRDDAARAEAAEVLRINPQFSLEVTFPTVGPKGKALAANERFAADLRKAGLK